MTGLFDKYDKWTYLDNKCNRRMKKEAPKEIKIEAKKNDDDYFNRTGRHMILVED